MNFVTTIRIAALLCATLIANQSLAQTARPEDGKARVAKAEAMFQERCKKAGEFIHRTAENVEGIFLMKVRPEGINYGHNEEQQFRLDDPYGHDSTDDDYIKSFLFGRDKDGHLITTGPVATKSYRYVEALDPRDGMRYRYTGRVDQPWLKDKRYGEWVREFVLDRTPVTGTPPRYGVTYDDISTREDREYWIAGSSLRVIDLKTKEVMAERIGYMWDPGQGNNSGGRSPWLLAADYACPGFKPAGGQQHGAFYQGNQARKFVESVLKPAQAR